LDGHRLAKARDDGAGGSGHGDDGGAVVDAEHAAGLAFELDEIASAEMVVCVHVVLVR